MHVHDEIATAHVGRVRCVYVTIHCTCSAGQDLQQHQMYRHCSRKLFNVWYQYDISFRDAVCREPLFERRNRTTWLPPTNLLPFWKLIKTNMTCTAEWVELCQLWSNVWLGCVTSSLVAITTQLIICPKCNHQQFIIYPLSTFEVTIPHPHIYSNNINNGTDCVPHSLPLVRYLLQVHKRNF